MGNAIIIGGSGGGSTKSYMHIIQRMERNGLML